MKAYPRKTKVLTDMLMIKLIEVKEGNFKCEELVGVLKALKLDKATGLDRIPAEVLKDCSRNVLHVMLSAINDIRENHEIPAGWEVSITNQQTIMESF